MVWKSSEFAGVWNEVATVNYQVTWETSVLVFGALQVVIVVEPQGGINSEVTNIYWLFVYGRWSRLQQSVALNFSIVRSNALVEKY